MPKYFYTAKSLDGRDIQGVLEAKDEFQVAKALKQKGLILISASLEKKKKSISFEIPFLTKISLTDKLMFTRNLQVMISAGLALPKSLQTLAAQAKSKKFKQTLSGIKDRITKGEDFSDALSNYPDVFPELFQNMIRVGEEGGKLEEVLGILSRQMEREHQMKSKIKEAMMYPSVIIFAMVLIGVLMLILVVPKISKTFEDLNIDLPVTTQAVLSLAGFFATNWILLILIIVLAPIGTIFLLKKRGVKERVDSFSLKVPFISSLIKKTNSAYMTRTLGSLIASGVPIVKALEITAHTLENLEFRKVLLEASELVRKGEKLSDALKPYQNIYTPVVLQMIKVGEETGETSAVLSKLADFFEEEVLSATKNLSAVIEPAIMLLVGIVVGFFAISMVQPMYSMLGAI